ncbi:MAG: DNA-deoxyinosine glycosylase [Methylococcaceae bacterium]|jgi:hypoxanthine-DNA glycosylase|nr:DNA-deoxyinosine glycosylase [Methylococcaceae bacterium]MDD1643539.1 DNA-deoxyinosine glycosylase [Methylococcaceae bacterium]OYV18413.1 MAG: T/U mismatch-specific DNA glycosylase [Methylococcaceae bacterium NSM2-1]
MSDIDGFAPIVSGNASVLILGSIPSEASLFRQQYYGHPRNAFWPIMSALFGLEPELSYQRRKEILMENGIAVWDVLQSCNRLGSLDSNIKLATIRTNDFAGFFTEYKRIKRVFFNGRMAEKLYQKRILPALNHRFFYLEYQCLPSTSPAYASLKFEQKVEAWKVIKQHVVK